MLSHHPVIFGLGVVRNTFTLSVERLSRTAPAVGGSSRQKETAQLNVELSPRNNAEKNVCYILQSIKYDKSTHKFTERPKTKETPISSNTDDSKHATMRMIYYIYMP